MAEPRTAPTSPPRPLSPHLQIYRFTWTMAMSILHRATGIATTVGMVVLTWWLVAAAAGPRAYAAFAAVAGSWIGVIALVGFTWALVHHAAGGVRHMVQDAGYGFDPAPRRLWAIGSLVGSFAVTVLIWLAVIVSVRG